MALSGERKELLDELARASESNPLRSLAQIVMRAAAHSPAFAPDDATDADLLHGFRNLAVDPPRTGS